MLGDAALPPGESPAVAGGLVILLVAIIVLNRARGRSFSVIPRRLGMTELGCRSQSLTRPGAVPFSGFWFAIAIFTGSTCREELLEELTSEMRRGFKDRGEYLRLRERVA
ncbi:MAG: hypothetical protein ACM33U_08260 [Solirubrobacterales bacterium]